MIHGIDFRFPCSLAPGSPWWSPLCSPPIRTTVWTVSTTSTSTGRMTSHLTSPRSSKSRPMMRCIELSGKILVSTAVFKEDFFVDSYCIHIFFISIVVAITISLHHNIRTLYSMQLWEYEYTTNSSILTYTYICSIYIANKLNYFQAR